MRVGRNEFGHEPLNGQKQKPVIIWNGSAVITHRDHATGIQVEAGQHRRDVTLMRDAFGILQHGGEVSKVHGRTRSAVPSIAS
jgi:hypothetical protein